MSAPTYPLFFPGPGPGFETAVQIGGYVPEYPLGEARPDAVVITAPFMQLRANYARPDPNSRNCAAYPTAYFCDDRDFRDYGHGLVTWTREWATLPGQWSDYESYAFRFPGIDSIDYAGRDPFTATVPAQLLYSYFLAGPGGTVGDAGAIALPDSWAYPDNYLTDASDPTAGYYMTYYRASTYRLVIDTPLKRWRGNIWERCVRAVTAL